MPLVPPDSIDRLAALGEPTRRALYEAVAAAPDPLTRDEAAALAHTSRALAAFHLDKLVDLGLLTVEFRRLSGREGPGAGRPSKLYRPAVTDVAVSLPPRHYDLAGDLLARALEASESARTRAALARAARARGKQLGALAREQAAGESARARRQSVLAVLDENGYRPVVDKNGDIRLRNCPFHALAADHRALVCGMNLALIRGVTAGSELAGFTPELDPAPGYCCVVMRRAT